jgi:hypothetical protein
MNFRNFRSRIAAWATFGLVATSLVAIAPAANANGDGYSPTNYFFTREASTPGSMLIKNGETVTVYSEQSLSEAYAWPAPLRSVFSRSAFTQTRQSIAGLSSLSDSKMRWWSGYSTADPLCSEFEENGGNISQESTNFTINAGNRCVEYLSVSDQITFTNTSGSSKTVVTNSQSQVLKVGKRDISAATGASRMLTGYVEVPDVSTVTTVSGETNVRANFQLCINEDLVDPAAELEFDVTWSKAGNALTSEEITVNYYDENYELASSYTVPEDNPYDQQISLDVWPNDELSGPGAHVASADVTFNGSSVLEECPEFATEPGWPTINTIDGIAEGPQATSTSRTMPTDTYTANDNWERYWVFADGFGGAFHSGVTNDDGAGTVTLVKFDGTSAQNDYNGTGGRQLASDSGGYVDLGRYGAAGANQFTLVPRSKGNWEYTTSTMTGANPVTRTLSKATLAKLCERGFTFGAIYALNTPTANPTALVGCSDRTSYRQVLVSIVNNVPTVLTRFGTPTRTRPCVGVAIGSNTAATGTEVALVAYARTMARGSDGFCTGGDVAVSARTITSLTAAGVATTSPLASSPWGEPGEPFNIQIAPDATSGNWVGMTSTMGEEFQSIPANLFTMTSSAITEGTAVVLDDSTDFGSYAQYDIVRKVSSGKWLISINSGDMYHDGESIVRATVASVNTSNGAVTNGDVVELSGYGWSSGRTRSLFSGNGPNGTTFFAMTGENSYSTTTWSVP